MARNQTITEDMADLLADLPVEAVKMGFLESIKHVFVWHVLPAAARFVAARMANNVVDPVVMQQNPQN